MTDNARLSVRVHPGARRDELSGVRAGVLHAGVTAVDPGAAANRALTGLLARRLGVGPEQIAIVSGADVRVKQIRIDGLGQAAADGRLGGLRTGGWRSQRRVAAAGLAVAAIASGAIALGGESSPTANGGAPVGGARTHIAAAVRRRRNPTRGRASPTWPSPRLRRRAPDPGRLPQTARLPSADTREFVARMQGLWTAIAGGPIGRARAAYFPEGAYAQLKAVGDPAGDFANRLYADYRLDIAAAHALLGVGASRSRLLRTAAVAAYAHWVPPNVCDNQVGYFELPNARLVYREDGQVGSIGIASLISWRGVWYVVHLGAILRGTAGGVVSAPSAGSGISAPSSTC